MTTPFYDSYAQQNQRFKYLGQSKNLRLIQLIWQQTLLSLNHRDWMTPVRSFNTEVWTYMDTLPVFGQRFQRLLLQVTTLLLNLAGVAHAVDAASVGYTKSVVISTVRIPGLWILPLIRPYGQQSQQLPGYMLHDDDVQMWVSDNTLQGPTRSAQRDLSWGKDQRALPWRGARVNLYSDQRVRV